MSRKAKRHPGGVSSEQSELLTVPETECPPDYGSSSPERLLPSWRSRAIRQTQYADVMSQRKSLVPHLAPVLNACLPWQKVMFRKPASTPSMRAATA